MRAFLSASVAFGVAGAVLLVAQATLLADLVARTFLAGAGLAELSGGLATLAAVVVARAALAGLAETVAHRTSGAVKARLRQRLLAHAVALGPGALPGERTGSLATLATRGLDALDGYFARYLPQLVLACVVPLVVGARILAADWIAAVTIGVTLPLIPVFMALVGLTTQQRTARQWRRLELLAGHFLDMVAGLPTLKVFGRAKAQARAIQQVTDEYRQATLATLRLAFLSSLVLELLATLSVALVAVGIGLRLLHGALDLRTALLVLILAPEAYLPLRLVGAHYHASAEGMTAAAKVFDVLQTPLPPAGDVTAVPDPSRERIQVQRVTVTYPDRPVPALDEVTLDVLPGEILAITGPSGSGKSTLLATLLGFVRPVSGRIMVDGVPLADLDLDAWRSRIAWVPQRPHLFAGTAADNIRLARPEASDAEVAEAARQAGALEFLAALPDGLSTRLGEGGAGLSAGQRQRLALARAFLADRPLVLLDEPTSHLDADAEAGVVAAIERLAAGRTVVIVTHRPALLALADRVVRLSARQEVLP
ncbi:ABC transporter [Carbonactinospora thermoautotrophica]|uniref:ABC transporter n=1 Tax=Carbonactinospora thermoautotrophica TaxID=1469144 RepID=A0A132MXN8_9ACTN|nr:ABC transporter [Carbonactinospora thermoautotrophica]